MQERPQAVIENLKNINDRNIKLSKLTEKDLDQLYLRVFNSEDGELVMQDMANRCHVYTHTEREFDEGMRALWLSIQSRLQGAVTVVKEEVSDAG